MTTATDGGTPEGGDSPDGGDTTGDLDARDLLARIWANDSTKLLVAFLALYLVYVGFGLALGYGARGVLNSLSRLTFLVAVYALLALALNLHWGYTGLFNIGIAGFMAVGLYTMAMVSKPVATGDGAAQISGLGLPLPVGIAAGVLAAALLGLVAALPALRLRADYLAITTIALSEIVRFIYLSGAFQTFQVFGVSLGTGGGRGLILNYGDPMDVVYETGPYQALIGWLNPYFDQNITPVIDGVTYALVLLVVFVGGYYWLLRRTGKSPFGRVLKAIREDEEATNALGKDTDRFKIKSFMLGCGLMGLAGILWQLRQGAITPSSFRPQITFYVWVALIIGGAGSNTGSILGGALFVGALFQGPRYVKNVVSGAFDLGSAPNTIAGGLGPLFSGDPVPLVAYALANVNSLQLVFMGVVLVILVQRRPEGLLGHRKEEAASIDLRRPPALRAGSAPGESDPDTAADGGDGR